MQFNFERLLEERRAIPLYTSKKLKYDRMCDVILESNEDNLFVLLPASFGRLISYEKIRNAILEKYYITDMHRVANVFGSNAMVKFCLYGFSKHKPQKIRVSLFNGNVVSKNPYIPEEINEIYAYARVREITEEELEYFTLIDFPQYTNEFFDYLENITNWIEHNKIPEDSNSVQYDIVDYSKANLNAPSPEMNTLEALSFFENLKKEAILTLSEIAEIKKSELFMNKDEERKEYIQVRFYDLRDGIDYSDREPKETFVRPMKIKKNDIIAPSVSANPYQFYLIKEDLPDNVCLRGAIVIRPLNISPQYLYMYLQSDKVKMYFDYMCFTLQLAPNELCTLPVIQPCDEMISQAEQIYKYVYCNADISLSDEINKILQVGNNIPKEKPLQELIGKELHEKLKIYKVELVTDLINNDMQELEKCFDVGAYKACIIICGSILETVMLDWLSEKENTDYFIKDDFIELNQIIKKVKLLQKHPEWKKYNEAQNIRKKRNLVHPAKVAKEHINIDKIMCAEVIKNLEEVLISRGIKTIK